jgi:hypothetical protein
MMPPTGRSAFITNFLLMEALWAMLYCSAKTKKSIVEPPMKHVAHTRHGRQYSCRQDFLHIRSGFPIRLVFFKDFEI